MIWLQVVSRYHVLALGGLRAEAEKVVPFLLTELNSGLEALKGAWQAEVSDALGGRKGGLDDPQEKVVVLYRWVEESRALQVG